MKTQVVTHVYRDDGTEDHDGAGRCEHCGLPVTNQHHTLPDTRAQMNEHRRRAGEEIET